MLPCLTLLLLTGLGLSVCTAAGDSEEQTLNPEAESWVTVTLEEGPVLRVDLQLQNVKRGKASQFFGLMGKRMGGIPPIQPGRRTASLCCLSLALFSL
ncbi:tachykinin-4 isoform X2 [Nycticebus coucang]|uniref:tachykinin-4 isoform X2 n=1 Tax=Nycticebus coucang TaxID=9470 RepID=UPI00234E2B9D|nr:tachykinin-4 isoform X2 [Nycticebus coucang]